MTHRILLVDDDERSRALLSTMLANLGYAVTTTATGDEAMQYLYEEEHCDLAIADVVMPGMSGMEFGRLVQDARPGLPLIYITARPEALNDALDAGHLVLPKPIARDCLASVIDDALETKA
jgi:CheY-like chemotaxis protein